MQTEQAVEEVNGHKQGGVTFYKKKPKLPKPDEPLYLEDPIDPFPKSPGFKILPRELGCIEPATIALDGIPRY